MSLRSFLAEMQKKNQIKQIDKEVSPKFEASALMKEFDNGPILYFDAVKGNRTKIVAGVCGTRQRLCQALCVSQNELYETIIKAWRDPRPPKIVRVGPIDEVVEKARLSKFPILTHFERDAGAYVAQMGKSKTFPFIGFKFWMTITWQFVWCQGIFTICGKRLKKKKNLLRSQFR